MNWSAAIFWNSFAYLMFSGHVYLKLKQLTLADESAGENKIKISSAGNKFYM